MSQDTATESAITSREPDLTRYIKPSFLNALPHYLPLGVFPLIFLALIYGGWWLLPPFIFMSVAGPADKLLGADGTNIDPKRTPERSLIWHNLPVWCWAFLWPPTLIFGMWQILEANPFAVWEEVILILILTMEAQAVFVVGHELVHRRTTWERRIAEFLLASGSYPQYATEHVYVHHAQVGTPNDVGSAPKGESFWHYFPKEVASNLINSWKAARARLARSHHPVWHYTNPFWRYGAALLFWYGLTYWMGGIWAVLVFIVLGFGCVFSMKIINYCQHYGLRRVRLPNGRWEKVMPRHSWDADWKFSNWMFFKMQRHSDHHAMASRHYPLLQVRAADDSPQLPGTYSDMMSLVVRPKRWFEKVDPLVDQWRKHFYPEIENWRAYDSPLAASHPEAFDAILEVFGVAPRLATRIERTPELLENLQDREFTDLDLPKGFGPDLDYESTARRGLTRLYWTHEMGVQEMKELIAELPTADAKETAEIVRNWSNDKAFQISMHVLRGNLVASEARIALSNLAEATIATVLAAVVADHSERNGPLSEAGFAGILLADLASREAFSGVPIKFLIVFDEQQSGMCERLARRSIMCLRALAQDNLLFSQLAANSDTCSVLPLSEVRRHFAESAEQGEIELTRARYIYECGDIELGHRFDDVRRECLKDYCSNDSLLTSLRLIDLNGEELTSLSYAGENGKLMDVDRIARILQLTNPGLELDDPAPTANAVFEHAGYSRLAQIASIWRDLQGIQSFIADEQIDFDHATEDVKTLVSTACGYNDYGELSAAVTDVASEIPGEIESIISKP